MIKWLINKFKTKVEEKIEEVDVPIYSGNAPLHAIQQIQKYSTDQLSPQEKLDSAIEMIETLKEFEEEFITCGIPRKEIRRRATQQLVIIEDCLLHLNKLRKKR